MLMLDDDASLIEVGMMTQLRLGGYFSEVKIIRMKGEVSDLIGKAGGFKTSWDVQDLRLYMG